VNAGSWWSLLRSSVIGGTPVPLVAGPTPGDSLLHGPPMDESRSRPVAGSRASWLLAAGAGLGLLAAAVSLLSSGERAGLPDQAVASVNDAVIRLEEYERAVEAFQSDRREPISGADREHVLSRLVDEELLVQRGLALGLARHDRRVRGDIVSAVIEAVVSQADAVEPDADEVEAFYEANRGYFARTPRVMVEQLLVRGAPIRSEAEARARADEAVRRLREGEPFARVEEDLGDPPVAPLPRDYLPIPKLREYVGPTAARASLDLAPGEVSAPLRSGTGFSVLHVVDRESESTPPLAQIEGEVRAELRRRAGDEALRRYLEDLRSDADVRVRSPLP